MAATVMAQNKKLLNGEESLRLVLIDYTLVVNTIYGEQSFAATMTADGAWMLYGNISEQPLERTTIRRSWYVHHSKTLFIELVFKSLKVIALVWNMFSSLTY